jgi:flagellar hook protein FlgE
MGISQALYTGVTGLSVNADGMSVIANNIANANGKGFKYDRAEFDDLLSVDMGSGSAQMGRGARLAGVKTIHTQGGLAVTENLSDLAIQGSGFFAVRNNQTEIEESGGMFFTRVGSFHFDKDGYLVDNIGGAVQGYMAGEDGTLSTMVSDIRIMTNNIRPVATSKVMMNVNLDSRVEPLQEEFDITRPDKTSNFANTVNIYDSHGRAHAMTTYFRRLPDEGNGPRWEYYSTVKSDELADPGDSEYSIIGRGAIQFDLMGNLQEEEQVEFTASFNKGALPNQEMILDFGKNRGAEGGDGMGASTSTAATSSTTYHDQNGYEAGNLKSLKIDQNGDVKAFYTNGLQRRLGSIAIANFENIDGLQKAGRNQFYKTLESGPPKMGTPQSGGRGSIYASTLEESNVDLATQFVNMIMTQRGFQANSRTITTTDTMLEEVLNLKR